MPNRWTDRDQIWHMYADSSENGHRLNKVNTSRPHGGGVWGKQFKSVGNRPLIGPTCNMTDYTTTIPGEAG